ncbi:MAG TPA: hypothetical protein VFV17_06410, partial [Usitatibacteraceae bacterium]|nr:hypothetical protein [Usitatibacteraceae bacterium]
IAAEALAHDAVLAREAAEAEARAAGKRRLQAERELAQRELERIAAEARADAAAAMPAVAESAAPMSARAPLAGARTERKAARSGWIAVAAVAAAAVGGFWVGQREAPTQAVAVTVPSASVRAAAPGSAAVETAEPLPLKLSTTLSAPR